MGGLGDTIAWTDREDLPEGAKALAFGMVWNLTPPSGRAELLNLSRGVDLLTNDYLALAELIELAVMVPWRELPSDLRQVLEAETICRYRVEGDGAGVYVNFV